MLVTETETMSNKRVTTTTRPMIYVIHRDMIIDKTATGMSRLIGTETVGEMMTPIIRVKMVTRPAIMGRTVTKSQRKRSEERRVGEEGGEEGGGGNGREER